MSPDVSVSQHRHPDGLLLPLALRLELVGSEPPSQYRAACEEHKATQIRRGKSYLVSIAVLGKDGKQRWLNS